MKYPIVFLSTLFCLCTLPAMGSAFQEEVTVVAPTSEAAEGLDLQAVAELFKDAETVEGFERALNDPETGVNNLDLDENGEVDYIRVVEQVSDDTHLIILQAALAENEFQDVATIEVEKNDDDYNLQVRGNEEIYGSNYYVQPTVVHVHTWPIITWIYRPAYRPYRSAFYFGFYPRWWRPYRPVSVTVYRTRTVRFTSRRTFAVSRTTHVRTVTRVKYQPRSSTLVKKKTVKTTTVKKTTVKTGSAKKVTGTSGKSTTVKGARRVTNTSTGKTTTVKGKVKKTTNPETGKTTVTAKKTKKVSKAGKGTKKAGKKTTKKKGKKKTVKKGAKKTRKKH